MQKNTGFTGVFILYPCKEQADIGCRYREHKAVHTVQGTAVAGDKVGEILYADHTLEHGFCKVAKLTHSGSQQGGEHTKPQGNGVNAFIDEENQHARYNRGEGTGNAAFPGLFGAYMWGQLMLSKLHAAKKSEAVANPGGCTGQHDGLPPNIADTDYKDETERQAGIAQAGESVQSAATGDLLMQHTGKQGKIHTDDKADCVVKISRVEICQHSLYSQIKNHYPKGTAGIQFLNILAVFICTNSANNGEE